uniref:Protein TsetseEP domain-containing protein n=1 Tax=Glossina brevipalpis TaxID=37001 RepID=A0A1A9WQG1_9MUSC
MKYYENFLVIFYLNIIIAAITIVQANVRERDQYFNMLKPKNDCLSYVERLEDILKQFRKSYTQCLAEANGVRVTIDENMRNFREELVNRTMILTYGLLDNFNEIEDHLEFFRYSHGKVKDFAKNMSEISMIALDMFDNGSEQYYRIEYDLYKCTNDTNRHYQRQYWNAYMEMENCIYDKEWKHNDYITLDGLSVTAAVPTFTTTTTTAEEETTSVSETREAETTTVINNFNTIPTREQLRNYYEELYKKSYE